MTVDGVIRFVHIVAAAVWVGGIIVTAAVMASLQRAGAGAREVAAAARGFGSVAWPAMALSVATGIAKIVRFDLEFDAALTAKVALTVAAVVLAFWHQTGGGRRLRAQVQSLARGLLLLTGLGLIAASVWL